MQSTLSLEQPRRRPWAFVPSLYFTEGLPYCVVMLLSTVYFKSSGISNSDIALWTSGFYLPWVIKPIWSPLVEMRGRKRSWIVITQIALALSFLLLTLATQLPAFFFPCVALLWLAAFLSATHDIAADGFYVLGLTSHEQAYFVGIRSTFYRLSMIFGQGGLIILAGTLEERWGSVPLAWGALFATVSLLLFAAAGWHSQTLPRPVEDRPAEADEGVFEIFRSFFAKEGIGWMVLFLLTYRLGEAQLLKMATPFLLDSPETGGLALSTASVGWIYGIAGVAMLVVGGLLGGFLAARFGLKRCLLPMWMALNLPNLVYLYLAWLPEPSEWLITFCIATEQFGYGIGFTGYMLTMLLIAGMGKWKVAHYAITTGFMALGMMLPGMISGYLQEVMGYSLFFLWVLLSALPAYLAIRKLTIPADFGLV